MLMQKPASYNDNNECIFKSLELLALCLFSLSYGLIIFIVESYVRD